ncbi:MAG TPA: hypothetical protein VKU01_36540 [Bryobacteraceae bacterium]|nr:hypothetical protein [Bryobacteraceae bacterium]
MLHPRFSFAFLFLISQPLGLLLAQAPNSCATGANPPVVRAEGLTERLGDIVFDCIGTPGATLTGNFTVSLNIPLSNRVGAGATVLGTIFSMDQGSGQVPIPVLPLLTGSNGLAYNGVSFTFSSSGRVTLRIAGIRGNATQAPTGASLFAYLAVNASTLLPITNAQVTVGTPERGLYTGFSSKLVCAPNGSPLPDTISFSSLIASNAIFATTRVTEGFGDAFTQLSASENLNADTGTRIVVRYSGFPAGARLFVPDVVAGSDAVQPTAGGDFGVPPSGGAYRPSKGGSLLLARVPGADNNGAGGSPVYTPGAAGSAVAIFDSVSELSLQNGSAYAVYEVVDANPTAIETAQFPTFLGLAPSGGGSTIVTSEDVFFAPVSTIGTTSPTAPIPRFLALGPLPDCTIIGDCNASYVPKLMVNTTPLVYQATTGSDYQVNYVSVRNGGSGVLRWVTRVTYASGGSGWLRIDPTSGVNNATIRIDALPDGLAPGTYQATVTVDAGVTGSATIPITFTVTVAGPSVASVVNSASLTEAPVVPGSLSTVWGAAFDGKSVTATFDGISANILFSNTNQINLLVPTDIAGQKTTQLVVAVDGMSSAARTVPVINFQPAIFPGAILNQDYSVNSADNGADPGSVIQVFATGLSGSGTITGHIHDRDITAPYYAGPAPTLLGVQQIDLVVPADLPAMTTSMYVCGTDAAGTVCSSPAPLTLR